MTSSEVVIVADTKQTAAAKAAAAKAAAAAAAEVKKQQDAEAAKAEFFTKYKTSSAFFNSVPELSGLLSKAFTEGWSADKLGLAYQDSNWFNSHLASQRDYAVAKATDKGAYAEQYNNLLNLMKRTAQTMGIDISSFGGEITPDQVGSIQDSTSPVGEFLAQHYNSQASADLLQNYIASHGVIAGTAKTVGTGGIAGSKGLILGGSIADNVNALKSYAATMGVASQYLNPNLNGATGPAGTDYFTNAAQSILSGTTNIQKEQEYIKNQAMAMYKPFASRISEGQTVQALASPYINSASNLLEVDPSTIDLAATTGLGSTITKAIQGDGTNPLTLDAFNTQIKQRPEWLQTSNARNSLMDTASTLLRNFGLVVGG
jgi:hypothetical protein